MNEQKKQGGSRPGSGRKAVFKDPAPVQIIFERDELNELRDKHGKDFHDKARRTIRKMK